MPLNKIRNYCSYYTHWFFKTCKAAFFVSIAICVAGLIIGIIVGTKQSMDKPCINYLILISTDGYSVMWAYLKQCLLILAICGMVFIAIFNKKLLALPLIMLFILGYQFGSRCVRVVVENSVMGTIYVIIYLAPIMIIVAAFISILIACMREYIKNNGIIASCSRSRNNRMKLVGLYILYSYIVSIIVIMPFCVIIPCIARVIIIA